MTTEVILKVVLTNEEIKKVLGGEMYLEDEPNVIDKELLKSCLEESIETFISRRK